jgi:hypothetical protein
MLTLGPLKKLFLMNLKKMCLSLCLLPAWCAAQTGTMPASAGVPSSRPDSLKAQVKLEEPVYLRNSVKMNLTSLALNNYSFSYERVLSPKISVVGSYGFMPEKVLGDRALVKRIAERFTDEEDDASELDKITTSTNTFTGEVRLYGGKYPGARGFYASLYGRYMRLNVNYPDSYQSVENKTYQIPYQGTLQGVGAGLMVGFQWLIRERVTLDWYILGGHYGKMFGEMVAVKDLSKMSPAEKAGLKEDIEYYVRIGETQYMEATVTEEGVKAKAVGPFLGVRGFGINLGIAF